MLCRVCPSVRQSQAGIDCRPCRNDSRIEVVFLAWRLPFIYRTLCYKKTRVSPKIRIHPSGTLSQTTQSLDLEIFALASPPCQQNLSTVELVDLTCNQFSRKRRQRLKKCKKKSFSVNATYYIGLVLETVDSALGRSSV